MEGLIFSLPILIIFFFILFQIFSIVKRVINTLLKKFQLTIDQAGEEGKRSDSLDDLDYNQYDEEEVEKRINEAEKKSLAKRKEEILNRGNNSNKNKKADERQINELKKPNKSNSFAKTFSQYSEVEKVVIYNEILSKPKALRKN
ncbi:hypothetical protein HSACCH_02049 [Halanaerobium saccharolyticum subsp. saccharolyticum DSM 6643]|uniref:Uncharacterized protein n=1 Tax=Halanaerobium saccharolyticum subsp. saccharolyticum DSM 6643 TaxID=1293054 RepID=M5E2R1_9FIRM|nr:hypothetical protein HSACCH_02049 [Halanaerobium saccharolyticum subsp. saccharolyticum DSM 6643]